MDKVSDLLIRIKNGYMASRLEVSAPHTKLAVAILEVLLRSGYIGNYKVSGRDIAITLKYVNRLPALTDVKRISKPGRRAYSSKSALPRVLDGTGIALISTPRGVMTDKQARKENLGGEVMAFIW